MQCEVCGRRIHGSSHRVEIEGARLTVCGGCSKYGKLVWEEEPKPKSVVKQKKPRLPLKIRVRKHQETPPKAIVELVEDFDARIRQAREKIGLSHEDLGKKIKEKVSLLRKIETKKMMPDNLLAAKLEHVLKVKLIVPASEEKVKIQQSTTKVNRELTLGDLVQLDKKQGKEDTAERRQS